jgi:HPt (histidine-containing phosphotransfer) domain-containing protein
VATTNEFCLITSTAYRIFVEELAKHLAKADQVLVSDGAPANDLRDASNCFHTIKGGAGFFGLSEIAKVAGELEKLLLTADFQAKGGFDRSRNLVAQLHELSKAMPKPQ